MDEKKNNKMEKERNWGGTTCELMWGEGVCCAMKLQE